MVTVLQYWTGVGVLAAFAMAVPIFLVIDGEALAALFIGVPTAIALAVMVALTLNKFSDDGTG